MGDRKMSRAIPLADVTVSYSSFTILSINL